MLGGSPFPTLGLSISREPAMHGVLTRMLLHQLLDEAGGERPEAARRVGVGRTTMYRWIKAGFLDPRRRSPEAECETLETVNHRNHLS